MYRVIYKAEPGLGMDITFGMRTLKKGSGHHKGHLRSAVGRLGSCQLSEPWWKASSALPGFHPLLGPEVKPDSSATQLNVGENTRCHLAIVVVPPEVFLPCVLNI